MNTILIAAVVFGLFLLFVGISRERHFQEVQRLERRINGRWVACQTGFRKVPGTGFAPSPKTRR